MAAPNTLLLRHLPPIGFCVAILLSASASVVEAEPKPVAGRVPTFEADIVPIVRKHCFACHGAKTRKSGLDLRTFAGALRGGESEKPVIVAGNPGRSHLFELVSSGDMPPAGRERLKTAEIRAVETWIESGAAGTPSGKVPDTFSAPFSAPGKPWRSIPNLPSRVPEGSPTRAEPHEGAERPFPGAVGHGTVRTVGAGLAPVCRRRAVQPQSTYRLGNLLATMGNRDEAETHLFAARQDLPDDARIYYSLVADQESVTRELIEFCGLDWDDACLAFHQTNRTVRTASFMQVREPIYTRSLARWKRYEKHLGPIFAALPRS